LRLSATNCAACMTSVAQAKRLMTLVFWRCQHRNNNQFSRGARHTTPLAGDVVYRHLPHLIVMRNTINNSNNATHSVVQRHVSIGGPRLAFYHQRGAAVIAAFATVAHAIAIGFFIKRRLATISNVAAIFRCGRANNALPALTYRTTTRLDDNAVSILTSRRNKRRPLTLPGALQPPGDNLW